MSASTLTKRSPNSWQSWPGKAKLELRDKLRKKVLAQRARLEAQAEAAAEAEGIDESQAPTTSDEAIPWGASSPLLWHFVEQTTTFRLDPWQRVLCNRLQATAAQAGQRILIHAPPQWGKSVIVSQRFPAWLLAIKPTHRVKLACYNITHAAEFGGVIRDLMQEDDFRALFPENTLDASRVPDIASKEKFYTAARAALRDGQPSFKALGLSTGFVGQGADTLLIDDPYASPQDAYSPVIRESVWTFWSASAKVRLKDDANVIVMFHRYHEDDLAGKMWAERSADGSRKWEMWRFAAEADDDDEMPDPLGRQPGEYLSPRMTDAYIAEQKSNALVWAGQFQGKPAPIAGAFFDAAWFKAESVVPSRFKRIVRYWDIAGAQPGKGDWTVGVLMGEALKDAEGGDGKFWILDVQRFQKSADERDAAILEQAKQDKRTYPGVKVYIEQAPGLAKEPTDALVRKLAGYSVEADPVHRDKVTRAEPYQAQARAGNVRLKLAAWNPPFLAVHTLFPFGTHDDDVDAASGAFNKLTTKPVIVAGRAGGAVPNPAQGMVGMPGMAR